MDSRFLALEKESLSRAQKYILRERSTRARTFLEEAREKPYYPFQDPPQTIIDRVSQDVYDGILLSLETGFGIRNLPGRQQKLVFLLARHLLHSEDLADVLTSVLDLSGDDISKFADLLKRTSLSSIIAISELLISRFQFLEELRQLIYGTPGAFVQERRHLHNILERHTWLFGEQYHLMGSDESLGTLLPLITATIKESGNPDARIETPEELRDIPDLYLMSTKWHEGPKYNQHLIIELKRPSVRIGKSHIHQLKRYARQIVGHPIFSQRTESHKFTFILVSAEISDIVKETEYQYGEDPGLIGRPGGLGHPTQLWALRRSDVFDRRTEELRFLKDRITIQADPKDLDYLRSQVSGFLPAQALNDTSESPQT
jgi:hypothetical protein